MLQYTNTIILQNAPQITIDLTEYTFTPTHLHNGMHQHTYIIKLFIYRVAKHFDTQLGGLA